MATLKNPQRYTDEDIQGALDFAANRLGLSFRPQQLTAITSFIRGHDIFVSLPTGFGKSIIFHAAPLCIDYLRNLYPDNHRSLKALGVVVMPLKSLVSDQLNRAKELKLEAGDVSGGLTDELREGLASRRYSLLFASPESLLGDDGKEIFEIIKHQLCGFFIDETHCVAKWGNSSGDTKAFRSAYGQLGEIRARIKSTIPTVALTATATRDVRRLVSESLSLRNFVTVSESPERENIKHIVVKSATRDFDVMFGWLAKDLREEGRRCDRVVIYCQSRRVVSDVYASFLANLPRSQHKYVEMFHTNTDPEVQARIISSFAVEDGEVRVLVATIAYGMGVDCRGLHKAILCGRTVDLDDYVQMSGRIGRDGQPSESITLHYPGDSAGRPTATSMKKFLAGDQCRRQVIREVFGSGTSSPASVDPQNCCDVCSRDCSGDESDFEKTVRREVRKKESWDEFPLNVPRPDMVTKLEGRLEDFRLSLLDNKTDFLYCGADITSGLAQTTITQIIRECNVEFPYCTFVKRYAFVSSELAEAVWEIVCSSLERSPSKAVDVNIHFDSDQSDFSEEFSDISLNSEDEYEEPILFTDSDEN